MKNLVVATGNQGKLDEIREYLEGLNWNLQLKPKDLEVEETGDSFMANACLKASVVAQALGEWAIGDDSGLMVDALNGSPGIFSSRYETTDSKRIERLLRELGNSENRQGKFVCAVAVARSDGSIVLEAEGVCRGEITRSPRGKNGFGYDPIFYVPQYQQTFAEMKPDLKRKISHRGLAFTDLLDQFRNLDELEE